MLLRKTDKLFYRSFPYKAMLNGEWAFAARYFTEKDIQKIKKRDLSDWGRSNRAALLHPTKVIKLIELFAKFDKEDIRMRHEGHSLNVFFKDRSILDQLTKVDKNCVVEFWEPESEEALEYLLTNQRTEVKKELTHGCRYKIILKGNVNKIGEQGRQNFINLCNRHPLEFKLTDAMKEGLKSKHRYYWGSSYFYVREGKFLLMAQMILQPIIKEVVKIVTYDEVKQEEAQNG